MYLTTLCQLFLPSSKTSELTRYRKLAHILDILFHKSVISLNDGKKNGVAVSLSEQQQVKNVRTNSAILKQLLKLPIDPDAISNCYVLAMDWIGVCGYLFTVKKFNDVNVAHYFGDFVLPTSSSSFRYFQAVLDLLFSLRNHHIDLRKIKEPTEQRQSALNTLRSYRNVTPPFNEPSAPDTFFTLVKK